MVGRPKERIVNSIQLKTYISANITEAYLELSRTSTLEVFVTGFFICLCINSIDSLKISLIHRVTLQIFPEAVVLRCSIKKMLLNISQNSPENACTRVSFLRKLQALASVYNFLK